RHPDLGRRRCLRGPAGARRARRPRPPGHHPALPHPHRRGGQRNRGFGAAVRGVLRTRRADRDPAGWALGRLLPPRGPRGRHGLRDRRVRPPDRCRRTAIPRDELGGDTQRDGHDGRRARRARCGLPRGGAGMSVIFSSRGLRVPAPRPPERGAFISFEGGDGAGESTQIAMLRGHLAAERSVALLYAADAARRRSTLVRPHLARGGLVLGDRFLGSSVAYQGAGRELERHEIASLSLWAVEGLLPLRTILLYLPGEALKQRR